MSAVNVLVPVRIYDGLHPVAHPATLRLEGSTVRVIRPAVEQEYPLAELRVSPRIASAARFVTLPDGQELECVDEPWLDALTQQERSEGPVAWLERRAWAAIGSLGLVVLSLVLGYLFVLDALSDRIALAVPIEKERALGERSVASLSGLMPQSQLSDTETEGIRVGFAELLAQVPERAGIRLEFRSSLALGPNAFALPGGIIIVTDQLFGLMSSDEQVLAVLAHELGHVHHRHVLRQAVRSSGTTVIAGTMMGDASSLAGGMSSALVVLNSQYSREFEREADAYAANLLKSVGRSPAVFADALATLQSEQKRRGINPGYSFLASHPGGEERISRARAAASAKPAE